MSNPYRKIERNGEAEQAQGPSSKQNVQPDIPVGAMECTKALYELDDTGCYAVSQELEAIRPKAFDAPSVPRAQLTHLAYETDAKSQVSSLAEAVIDVRPTGVLAAIDRDKECRGSSVSRRTFRWERDASKRKATSERTAGTSRAKVRTHRSIQHHPLIRVNFLASYLLRGRCALTTCTAIVSAHFHIGD